MTADLHQKEKDVPKELVPSVKRLSTALRAVEDPHTPPHVRDATTTSAQQVSAALEVIGAPDTPPATRRQLTGVVQQVTSTLEAAQRPGVRPDERRTATFIAARATSLLPLIGDRKTPPQLRRHLTESVRHLTHARSERGGTTGDSGSSADRTRAAKAVEASWATIRDPHTPGNLQKELAKVTHETSSSLDRAGDPEASADERDQAQKDLDKQLDHMKKELEKAASAQGLPNVPLPKAAEVCTNAVFDYVDDDVLIKKLGSVLPKKWDTEGVDDFWKSEEAKKNALDIRVLLRGQEDVTDAPVQIKRLAPKLADTIPAEYLYVTLGTPGLNCLRAALDVYQVSGVTSGTWVKKAKEME
ncbi:hypothetical protein ABZ636_07990 [Streptomyces sp. NPDC007251]|uniref:hypothetical protein n=1 Tax=Streptomyces sp. NPDC007251 TaxID=3154483 RepID=UPI00340D4450